MMDLFSTIEAQIHSLSKYSEVDYDPGLRYDMLVSFLEIHRLNRHLNNATRRSKVACLDYKALLDKLHLSIKNLNYESQYILKEIDKCNSQETLFQDIELFTVEEFKEFSESVAVDFEDSYQLMKARLEHELLERKKMTGNLLSLKEKKIDFMTQIKSKQMELEQFEKGLLDILQTSLPLQKQCGVEQTIVRNSNLNAVQSLPAPLFHIYNSLSGYLPPSDIFIEVQQSHESDKMSTDYQSHPGFLKFNVRQDDIIVAVVQFRWLIKWKIVIVSADLTDSFDNIPSSFILSNLFKNDDGLECPNPVALSTLDGVEFDVNSAYGFPFVWAQALAGLSFPTIAQFTHLSKNGIWINEGNMNVHFLEKISLMIQDRRKLLIRVNTVLAGLVLKLGNKKELGGQLLSFSKIQSPSISSCTFQLVIEAGGRKFGTDIVLYASYPFTPCSIGTVYMIGPDHSSEIILSEQDFKMDELSDSCDEKLIEKQIILLISNLNKQ